jgi:hypothetical protein
VKDALITQLHGLVGVQGQVEWAQSGPRRQPDGNEQLLGVHRGNLHQRKVDHQNRGKEQKMGILRLGTETRRKGWENWMEKQLERVESLDSTEFVFGVVSQVKWMIRRKETLNDASSDV